MDDLARWYGAQLDEDERIARRTHGPLDGPLDKKWWTPEDFKTRLCDDQISMGDAEHMACHSPARVLREIEARRQVIAAYATAVERVEELAALAARLQAKGQDVFMVEMDKESAIQRPEVLHGVLRMLAAAYADRPGYREEWRP